MYRVKDPATNWGDAGDKTLGIVALRLSSPSWRTHPCLVGWPPTPLREEAMSSIMSREFGLARASIKHGARRTTLPPTVISAASYIHESNKQFHNEWEMRAYQLRYLGTSFMRLKLKNRRIKPRRKSADCYIKACEDDNSLFARFTRMVTNHAPIGSYYRRFPHLNKSELCLSPGWRFESRDHVLDKCSRYSRCYSRTMFAFVWLHLSFPIMEGLPINLVDIEIGRAHV